VVFISALEAVAAAADLECLAAVNCCDLQLLMLLSWW
jgi:hypothetical protein